MPENNIFDLLAKPFDPSLVRFKPAVVSGNRALALAYVDARAIQDRLDNVLSPVNWQDDYEAMPDGSVICRLRIRVEGEWITKTDVGSPSEQPDSGDRMKAAFSDALKRAAVKFGIGRYLYRFPAQWLDYDPQRRQFLRQPRLPDFAIPHSESHTPAINMDEVERLYQLLLSCGRQWESLRNYLGLPHDATPEDMNREQYEWAMRTLQNRRKTPSRAR